ncbi:MAG: TlpA disulfide reductase family protein [Actinomycetota bacterium]
MADIDLVDGDARVEPPAPSGRIRWISAGVGLFLVAFIALLALGPDDRLDPDDGGELLGQRVPEIAAPTLDGGSYDIDDAGGRWVVVNFFATWCVGCINEHPELVELDQWARDTGQAEIVAVVFNDPPEAVAAFFDENGGGWPVVNDPAVPVAFRVSQIPETFLVSPSGQIVQHIQGEVTAEVLIDAMTGEQ